MADVAAAFKPGKELNVFPEQARPSKPAQETSASRTDGKGPRRKKPTKREAAEEAARTVFVGNVPVDMRKKAIIRFFRDAVKEVLGEAKVAEIAPAPSAVAADQEESETAAETTEAADAAKDASSKKTVAAVNKVAKGGGGIISSVRIRSFGVAEKMALAPGATYKHLLKAAYITGTGSGSADVAASKSESSPSGEGEVDATAAGSEADSDQEDEADDVDIAGATAAAEAAATEAVNAAKTAAAAAKGDKAAARAAEAAAAAAAAAASANAYVVFTHVDFAKAALQSSGKVLGGRHIRVDAVRVPGVKAASAEGGADDAEGGAAEGTASGFDEKSSLFLGHLPWALDEEGVWSLVGPHVKGGAEGIRYVRLLRDRITRRSKGVAYVGLKSQGAVGAVAKLLNGQQVQGRTITASKCLPQTALAAKRRAGVLGKGASKQAGGGKKGGVKRARSGDRSHMGATPGQQAQGADASGAKKKSRSAGAKVAASARRSAAKRKAGSNSGTKAAPKTAAK